jgi:hypothetical protein
VTEPWQLPRPTRGTDEHRAWIVACYVEAARRIGCHPYQVGRVRLAACADGTEASWPGERDVAAIGGGMRLRALLAYEHDEQPEPAELAQRQTTSRTLAYVRKLERDAGDSRSVVDRLRAALADAVAANPPQLIRRDRAPDVHASPDSAETVALLSDTHYGSIIERAEVPSNAFDWTIAARRTALFASQIAAWKPHHRSASRLRLLLGGDIIEGEIHGQSRAIDALATQVDGARQILTAMIDYLRGHYAEINVVCTPGNHGRWPQREGRAVSQKWDGLATVLYRGLEAVFRACPDVRFSIPLTPYSTWTAPGGVTCALTHGDTVIHGGALGRSVNVERLATQVRRWNAARPSDAIRVLAMGHYHTPLVTELEDGTVLVVNGTLSGTAPYAQSLGVHGSHPVQLLWESVPGHPVGDVRFVRLSAADGDAALDAIVPTPTPIGS